MLNWIWLALVVLAVAIGGWNNRVGEVTGGAFARREDSGHYCAGSHRDHGVVARRDAAGGTRWTRPTDRPRSPSFGSVNIKKPGTLFQPVC